MYQQIIRTSITAIAALNNKANPNTTQKTYYRLNSKRNNTLCNSEEEYFNEYKSIEEMLSITDNLQLAETLKTILDEKKKSLGTQKEQRLKGIILGSKAQIVEQSEKMVNILQV